jgi:hypothetical protein
MAEDKKKKKGLQKNVTSIFNNVPIPQKTAGDKTRQTPNASEPRCESDIPEPVQTTDSSFEPERNVNIPEPEPVANTPELERTSDIPEEQKSREPQEAQASLFKEIDQPAELLRKDNPYKDLLIDADKKDIKPGLLQRIRNKLLTPKPGKNQAKVLMIPVLASVFIIVLRQTSWTAPYRTEVAVENEKPSAVTTISASSKSDRLIQGIG